MKIISFILFFLIVFSAFNRVAQLTYIGTPQKSDSLFEIVRQGKPDTNRVKQLILLARKFTIQNPDTAKVIGENSLQLAKQLKWMKGVASPNLAIGLQEEVQIIQNINLNQ